MRRSKSNVPKPKSWRTLATCLFLGLNLLLPLINETRKRKGLSREPPTPAEFIDKE